MEENIARDSQVQSFNHQAMAVVSRAWLSANMQCINCNGYRPPIGVGYPKKKECKCKKPRYIGYVYKEDEYDEQVLSKRI